MFLNYKERNIFPGSKTKSSFPWVNVQDSASVGVLKKLVDLVMDRFQIPQLAFKGQIISEWIFFTNKIFWQLSALAPKGQLISKADWRAIDSPKKQTDEFVLFAFLLFKANKSNLSVRFLGGIYGAPICFSVLSYLYLVTLDFPILHPGHIKLKPLWSIHLRLFFYI